jgi:hypothetical protein
MHQMNSDLQQQRGTLSDSQHRVGTSSHYQAASALWPKHPQGLACFETRNPWKYATAGVTCMHPETSHKLPTEQRC